MFRVEPFPGVVPKVLQGEWPDIRLEYLRRVIEANGSGEEIARILDEFNGAVFLRNYLAEEAIARVTAETTATKVRAVRPWDQDAGTIDVSSPRIPPIPTLVQVACIVESDAGAFNLRPLPMQEDDILATLTFTVVDAASVIPVLIQEEQPK